GIRAFHVTGVQTCALPISSQFRTSLIQPGGARSVRRSTTASTVDCGLFMQSSLVDEPVRPRPITIDSKPCDELVGPSGGIPRAVHHADLYTHVTASRQLLPYLLLEL